MKTKRTEMVHISWGGPFYRYGGYYFEVHPYLGPVPLNPDGDPTNKNPPRGFWKMWDQFDKLSQSDKDLYAAK